MKYAKLISTNQILMAEESGRPQDQLLNCMLSSGYEESDIQILSVTDAEYDALIVAQAEASMTYADKRKIDYPTIEELVVALYDTEDKADIDTRRAEVKERHPKP